MPRELREAESLALYPGRVYDDRRGRVVYSVPGMHCDNCISAVEGELARVDGVASVRVDLDSKLVTVRGESLSDAALRAAIDEAGYEAEP